MKEKYDLIFIVLTYRNHDDLSEFIQSTNQIRNTNYKIVVVNSYYDKASFTEIKKISERSNCDFVNVENRGYGFGNNQGINYVKKKYNFKYIVVSNPDIKIISFDYGLLEKKDKYIIAPQIITLNGKLQNPYYYSHIKLVELLHYIGCKINFRTISLIGFVINKINREFRLKIDKLLKVNNRLIYASHGSFVIFGRQALDKLGTVYDEDMFLFSEENHLANKAKQFNVPTIMISDIEVLHKEDGSVSFDKSGANDRAKESFIIYYEKSRRNRK